MREQIRLWFYSMLFMSVTLKDQAPYESVLAFEKLMDEQRQADAQEPRQRHLVRRGGR